MLSQFLVHLRPDGKLGRLIPSNLYSLLLGKPCHALNGVAAKRLQSVDDRLNLAVRRTTGRAAGFISSSHSNLLYLVYKQV
jgi:hypothetical protein